MALCAIGRHSRPGKKYLVGVHRIETVGLFASFWSQKEGHTGGLPFSVKGKEK